MVSAAPYSVVVPVRNEEAILPRTVPALLAATAGDGAEIVYVCNGCTDRSAEMIRHFAGGAVRVVELLEPGKVAALNAGDEAASAYPRFYLDADVVVSRENVAALVATLVAEEADLVAPRLTFDTDGCTPIARCFAEIWLSLPHAQAAAFQGMIGLSRAGRTRWGRFPDVLGDDIFMAAMVPRERRRIVSSVTVSTLAPSCLAAWLHARIRWRRGERMLQAMGLPLPRPPGQRGALLRMLVRPSTSAGAMAYVAVRLAADLASLRLQPAQGWSPDRAPLVERQGRR